MSKLTEAQQTIAEMEAKIAELVAASQAALELVNIVTAERDEQAQRIRELERDNGRLQVCGDAACVRLKEVIADRDALSILLLRYEKTMQELVTTDGLICSTSRWYYRELYEELSELTPQQHLAAHDAKVPAKAVDDFIDYLDPFEHDRVELRAAAEQYAAQLRTKTK